LYQANSGQQNARNNGAAHASGHTCLFLDDDIVAEPQLVAEHLRLHRQQDRVVGIGQITMNIGDADWYTKRFADGWHQHYLELNQGLRQPYWIDGYGGNISVSRALFMQVGGFAPDIRRSHDIELAFRLEKHGLTFVYLPQAIGRQDEHKRCRELFSDAAKSGAACVVLCRRHPEMLPELLGPLGDTSMREALLRQIFWRFGISPWFLVRWGNFITKTSWGGKWYRFLFNFGYWRGIRQAIPDNDTWQRMIKGVPILLYHAFGKPGERASRFVVPIKRFARQMEWLKRLKYHILSLEEYLQYRRNYQLPPPRSIVITMDDGYAEIAELVHPILRRYGFPATAFLVSGKIGGHNDWTKDKTLSGRQILSWSEIKQIAGQYIQFGAHTQTHARLPDISREQACEEIAGSKSDLENELQTPILSFAYPFGEFDRSVQNLVEQAGFLGGCSAESGINSWSISLTALRRLEVKGTWSLLHFLFNLRMGGY
jgi:peptidoglycan/xylan/chitin deacetylase (PgdA/CDA1 family)